MVSWLWIFGWFLALSALVPALIGLTGIAYWLILWGLDRLFPYRAPDVVAEIEEWLRSLSS